MILRRGSNNTQKNCTKKYVNDADNHDGVTTHLEPDILECEIMWALGSIIMKKAIGGDGISTEVFQTLIDDAVKVLHSMALQSWKTQQWPQDWTRSVFILIPKKHNAKECSNYIHTSPKIQSDTVCTISPSICHEVMGLDAMILVF